VPAVRFLTSTQPQRKISRIAVRAFEHHLTKFAVHRRLALVTVFFLALGAKLAVLPINGIPHPGIHDEFSYLLMADTFAHGRLTNPTHPMWAHFETFHVNQQPTYCSKYFPAQGLFLAVGQVAFGNPFWGVVISTALMCAAFCWAFQGWMPAKWALLGGVIVIVRLGVFSYWADSYWGGSVAALGGALVIGALPRIKRKKHIGDALMMGIGFALLANSRPYEGLAFSVPILVILSLWLFRRRSWAVARRVLIPLVAFMLLTFAAMCYYFWRTTGTPLRSPYSVYTARYDAPPLLPWKVVTSVPAYPQPVMREFYLGWSMQQYVFSRTHPLLASIVRLLKLWLFFVGPILSVPIVVAMLLTPYYTSFSDFSPKVRLLIVANLTTVCALLVPVYFYVHYAAPMTCALFTLLLLCFRRTRVWDRRSQKGRILVWATLAVYFFTTAYEITTARCHIRDRENTRDKLEARDEIIRQLDGQNSKYLIIVHYAADHNPWDEWVYNRADINSSKVVWAREMTKARDKELIDYFRERTVLLLSPDENPPRLTSYFAASMSGNKQGPLEHGAK